MIDLILVAAGLEQSESQARQGEQPEYLSAFQAARQAADAMLGLRVLVVTRPQVLDEAVRAFGFNKVVVAANRDLSQAMVAGTKAARSGASRCFVFCGQPWVTGERLTAFLQGYILSGRTLGRMIGRDGERGPMVYAPYLLPQLLALKNGEDGSALFQNREGCAYCWNITEQEG